MNKRPNPPGQHGAKRRRGGKSEYARQLLEKQRLKYQYNISEKQLKKYAAKAIKAKGNSADVLLSILETRLDNIVCRAGFAPSIFAARQFVVHGHIEVNGKKVDKPSYLLSSADIVEVKEKSKKLTLVDIAQSKVVVPPYIEMDNAGLTARIVRTAEREEIPIICEVQSVVEWYSK
ncbi:UNVERIFIED_CONTAM: hypothetical protein GTU68_002611 [Idotea baltica]|nr:hypothetical protein [Idotea baltica]